VVQIIRQDPGISLALFDEHLLGMIRNKPYQNYGRKQKNDKTGKGKKLNQPERFQGGKIFGNNRFFF
jgi:hypothetical protein